MTRFPVVGSGLGTFGLVEPATRVPGDRSDLFHEYAHNDYLQLWVEGGTAQIVLAAIVIALILIKSVRAVRWQPNSPNGRLALGGVIGFVAIVVHSFVDFGLHIPAVSLFTAVVAAMLVNVGEQAGPAPGPSTPPSAWIGWPLCLLQAGALMAVALLLVQHGRAEEQAERFYLASSSPRVFRGSAPGISSRGLGVCSRSGRYSPCTRRCPDAALAKKSHAGVYDSIDRDRPVTKSARRPMGL